MNQHPLAQTVNEICGGRLMIGRHGNLAYWTDDRKQQYRCACVLEACSIARRQVYFSDHPADARMPDLRPINDAFASDIRRTESMLPLAIALWDWRDWREDDRAAFVECAAGKHVGQSAERYSPARPYDALEKTVGYHQTHASTIRAARGNDTADDYLASVCAEWTAHANRIMGARNAK